MTPEGKLKAACRRWLRERGAYVFAATPIGYGPSTLDDLVCYEGLFYGIEYKVKPYKPTPRQKSIMLQIEQAGGRAILVYDIEDLIVGLR